METRIEEPAGRTDTSGWVRRSVQVRIFCIVVMLVVGLEVLKLLGVSRRQPTSKEWVGMGLAKGRDNSHEHEKVPKIDGLYSSSRA